MKRTPFTLLLTGGLLVLVLCLLLVIGKPTLAAPAGELTVCPVGPPTCMYNTIQGAVDAANDGDLIKVAAGLYADVNNRGGLAQIVYIYKSVTLRGGYSAPDFADPPDPGANWTTLDAQGQGRVIYIPRGITTTIEGLNVVGGDASGLGGFVAPWGTYDTGGGIYATDATVTLRDNSIFSNTVPSGYDDSGGGVALLNSHVTLVGNKVTNNEGTRGGGLSLRGCTGEVTNNTIFGNTAGNRGGGLYVDQSSVDLKGNTVASNVAIWGGGLYVDEGDPTISQSTFRRNLAERGGGLYLHGDATIRQSTVVTNTATNHGAGLYLEESGATLEGNEISANSARHSGGGLYLTLSPAILRGNAISDNTASSKHGGGLYLTESDATVEGNTISGNSAPLSGGGVAIYGSDATIRENNVLSNRSGMGGSGGNMGGGLYLEDSQSTLIGNVVSGNAMLDPLGWGAGVGLSFSDATLDGNLIRENRCEWLGGGVSLYNSDAALGGNTIVSNTAGYGGGLYTQHSNPVLTNTLVADNGVTVLGGGIFSRGYGSARLIHSTVARNSGGDGSGIYAGVTVWLTNTILVGHSVGITVEADCTATLEATLWGDGLWANADDWAGPGTIVTGTTNYWGDPAFVDPGSSDYHLMTGSAAIERGIATQVSIDIDGDPRPFGAGYDLGADEWTPPIVLTDVTINGPIEGYIRTSYTYSAVISPSNATKPIVYTWSPEPDSGQGTASAVYRWDSAGVHSIAVDAKNYASTASDTHNVTIHDGAAAVVDPVMGGTLVYTDAQGNPTTIDAPWGAVTETITLVYTPVATVMVPSGLLFAGHAFDLDAYRGGVLLPGFVFDKPVVVTIHYSDADVAGVEEASLVLEYWNGSAWEDAACGVYDRHPGANWLAVPICHLSRFGLFGPEFQVCPVPLGGVSITGPITGYTGISYDFTSVLTPANATEPITYTWSPEPVSGQGMAGAVYRWDTADLYSITLAAENCGGVVSNIAQVLIVKPPEGKHFVYLPLVLVNR